MNASNWMKRLAAIVGSALMLASGVGAAQEPVVVEVEFVDPITVTEQNPLQYGLLDQNLASGETVTISPADPTTVSGDTGRVLGGTQAAADLDITATAGHPITILVDNITSNTGYTLATFMCNYASGTDTACDGVGYVETSVASTKLYVGATLTGDGFAVVGVYNGGFDVTVAYQ